MQSCKGKNRSLARPPTCWSECGRGRITQLTVPGCCRGMEDCGSTPRIWDLGLTVSRLQAGKNQVAARRRLDALAAQQMRDSAKMPNAVGGRMGQG